MSEIGYMNKLNLKQISGYAFQNDWIWCQIDKRVHDQVKNGVERQMRSKVCVGVHDRVMNRVFDQVGSQIWAVVWRAVRSRAQDQARNRVANTVHKNARY